MELLGHEATAESAQWEKASSATEVMRLLSKVSNNNNNLPVTAQPATSTVLYLKHALSCILCALAQADSARTEALPREGSHSVILLRIGKGVMMFGSLASIDAMRGAPGEEAVRFMGCPFLVASCCHAHCHCLRAMAFFLTPRGATLTACQANEPLANSIEAAGKCLEALSRSKKAVPPGMQRGLRKLMDEV